MLAVYNISLDFLIKNEVHSCEHVDSSYGAFASYGTDQFNWIYLNIRQEQGEFWCLIRKFF